MYVIPRCDTEIEEEESHETDENTVTSSVDKGNTLKAPLKVKVCFLISHSSNNPLNPFVCCHHKESH